MSIIDTISLWVPAKYARTRGKIKHWIVIAPSYLAEFQPFHWGDYSMYSRIFQAPKPNKKALRRRTNRQNKKNGGRRLRERKHWVHQDTRYRFFWRTNE